MANPAFSSTASDEASPRSAYRFASYLADRVWALALGALALASTALVASVLGVPASGVAVLLTLLFVIGAALLTIEYLRRRRFYRDLEALAASVESIAMVPALLPTPASLESRVTAGAIEDLALRTGASEAALHQAFSDYRTYIEAWVHEVKTPLSAAQLMAARLKGPDGAALAAELERIENSVQSVLYYARTSTLAQDYLLREIALAPLLREACRKNARLLIERGCTPQVAVADAVQIIADRGWLTFILTQLIVNAAKYGATTLTFAIAERVETSSAGHTTLEVADNGWGIAPGDVPRVFERGFTGENGRTQGQATGMGLYLVATMTAAMGIGVELASELGVGTRVLLTFPHAYPSER